MHPPKPADEATRLRVLAEFDILDTPPETDYDGIAGLAARICGTPVALLTVMAADRQWFKARVGTDRAGAARDTSLCAYTVLGRDLLVVPDTRRDPRFAANPLVVAEPGVRFYAGAPLPSAEGHPLGTLCVLDRRPRRLTVEQARALRALGWQAVAQLELRRYAVARRHAVDDLRFRQVDLRGITWRAVEAVRPIAYLRHIRIPNPAGPPLPVLADPLRLERALACVLFAAVNRTPAGGRVRVISEVAAGVPGLPPERTAWPGSAGSLAVAGLILDRHLANASIVDDREEGTVLRLVFPEPLAIRLGPGARGATRSVPAGRS